MIKLSMVKKSYGDKDVLKDVTLEVRKRELLCLVGPNGSGKTTTLNVIAGLCRPDDGTVLIDGILMDGKVENRSVHVSPSERKSRLRFPGLCPFPAYDSP